MTLTLIAAATLLCVYALDRFEHRFVRSDKDLLGLLPAGDSTLFFAQMDVLRRAGMLGLITDARSSDADYRAFVRATRFDYWKDIDAIAGSSKQGALLLAIEGRFDWWRIQSFVKEKGGVCAGDECQVQGTDASTWIGMMRIQPNVIAMGIGNRKDLVLEVHPGQQAMAYSIPEEPVWVEVAPSLLKNPAELPFALRIFAVSLQPASSVVIALAPPRLGTTEAFEIKLRAQCSSASIADTLRSQLQLVTNTLRMELAREHRQPNPGDLTGLLTSGTFETDGTQVSGEWPVSKELLKTLQ